MWHNIAIPILMAVAGILSLGVSGGQVARCIRRKSSDDVTIAGWLSGAAACVCMLGVAFITNAWWFVLWEGLGILEYAAPAAVAWWYRSPGAERRASDKPDGPQD